MELTDAIRARRMVRRFDPARPLDPQVVRELIALAVRAPSAGFTQGWDFLALLTRPDRQAFWDAASPADAAGAGSALILCLSDREAYLDRYAEPDKGWSDRSLAHWPVPYWDTDTAMAAMLILLGATDRGLGSLFFGVSADRHPATMQALDIPSGHRIVGVIALGHEAERVTSPSLRRGRRSVDEVLHLGRFGASAPGLSEP